MDKTAREVIALKIKKPQARVGWAVADKNGYLPFCCIQERRREVSALLKGVGMRRDGDRIIKVRIVPVVGKKK